MALTDYSAYKTACLSATNPKWTLDAQTLIAQRIGSQFLATPNAPSAPTTAAACSNTTAGHRLKNPEVSTWSGVTRYISDVTWCSLTTSSGASGIIIDRLSHQGGLSGTVTTEQTTNLPTAALTRYTDGVGVFVALEIHTAVGTTATTVTARYTNQAGTGSRVTKAVVFGGTSEREAGRFIILPLADGDTGVKSVEGVTVLATTGTAGAFGVVLFRPLMMVNRMANSLSQNGFSYFNSVLGGCGSLVELKSGACVHSLMMSSGNPAGAQNISLNIIDG